MYKCLINLTIFNSEKKGFSIMDVSIIIVNYNTKTLLRNCLVSIFDKTKDVKFEVIISDNGSNDGSVEMIKNEFPQVIIIDNKSNLGFGTANNCGLAIAKGKYIFYLNSDTILLNNAVKIFFDYWESSNNEQLGALGCNLIDTTGEYIHSYGKFPKYKNLLLLLGMNFINATIRPFIRHIKKKKKKTPKYIGDVEYITGADLFLKNDINAKFDEEFFMYYEETDLQYRLSEKNKIRKIIDGPQIIHFEGASSKKEKERGYNFTTFAHKEMWYSACIYLKKNDPKRFHYKVLCKLLKIIWYLPGNRKECYEWRMKIQKL